MSSKYTKYIVKIEKVIIPYDHWIARRAPRKLQAVPEWKVTWFDKVAMFLCGAGLTYLAVFY